MSGIGGGLLPFEARIVRVIAAPISDVFDQWVTAEALSQWLAWGGGTVDCEFRVGGKLTVVMRNAGREWRHEGEFLKIEAPTLLEFTWRLVDTDERMSVVRVEFEAVDGSTRVTLTHRGVADPGTAGSYEHGWASILGALAGSLGGASPDA